MKSVIVKDVNLDLAKEKAIEELRVSENYVKFEVINEKKSLFKSEVEVEASVNIDLNVFIKEYLEDIYSNIGLKVEVNISEDKGIKVNVNSDDNALLIGRDGKNLKAMQTIVNSLVYNFTKERTTVVIDSNNYKEKRIKQLEILATKTAKDVSRTKLPVKLHAMNSFERRIVHAKLTDWDNIITESEGSEPNRYLVIKPNLKK